MAHDVAKADVDRELVAGLLRRAFPNGDYRSHIRPNHHHRASPQF
jgi:hypothetical protein